MLYYIQNKAISSSNGQKNNYNSIFPLGSPHTFHTHSNENKMNRNSAFTAGLPE